LTFIDCSNWKTKLRKTFGFSGKICHREGLLPDIPVDAATLSQFFSELVTIPVSTRLSSFIAALIKDVPSAAVGTDVGESNSGSKKKGKSGSKTNSAKVATIINVPVCKYPESSDDENDSMSTRRGISSFIYRDIPEFQLASLPELWPPSKIGRRNDIPVPTFDFKDFVASSSSNHANVQSFSGVDAAENSISEGGTMEVTTEEP
jgi:hypothetical protein